MRWGDEEDGVEQRAALYMCIPAFLDTTLLCSGFLEPDRVTHCLPGWLARCMRCLVRETIDFHCCLSVYLSVSVVCPSVCLGRSCQHQASGKRYRIQGTEQLYISPDIHLSR